MNEQTNTEETATITDINQAEAIVNLGAIKIDNPNPFFKERFPQCELFNSNYQIFPKEYLLWLLMQHKGPLDKKKLQPIANFLATSATQQVIRNVHKRIATSYTEPKGAWYTGGIIYPLLNQLLDEQPDAYSQILNEWQEDWSTGVDPEKFRLVFSLLFKALETRPPDEQEKFVTNPAIKPLTVSDAELLSDIFEKIYGENYDLEKIKEADRRNRIFIEHTDSLIPTSEALFHTTELTTLPLVIDKGLLALECISLTRDWHREANFGVSFWSFKKPPKNLSELTKNLGKGTAETATQIFRKIHLAFLNPQSVTDSQNILYPPESFYCYRKDRKTIAGRYIPGADEDVSSYPNKAPAYVLIGLPSTTMSFIAMDATLKPNYASFARSFPFYLPAYSYEGKLLYPPEEYDLARAT